ncbi:membrane protein [Microbacterium phage Gingerbug]|nr:membrane protein [Microbacterium phage Gingerbug]
MILWALVLLVASALVGVLNLTVLHDGEVAFAALLGGVVAVVAIVAALTRKVNS